ncbi:MAG TPA: ABC transporter permease subunit, partial [Pirellulaceae bacterium]|nr:ABC transporter permease subunit [Pirellulaceae bacterium]
LLAPVLAFGRNIPMAALIILTFFIFGVGETQKVIFIFLACVAFVISDTATSIGNVNQSYVDTAYTLGASRWQVIIKTLVPLALPKVFDSLRLLFGLAFGYIMLAETVRLGDEQGGLGNLIINAQRRSRPEYIYLIIMIIPIVALAVDRTFYWIQRQLFPYRYGGTGILLQACQAIIMIWEKIKGTILPIRRPFDQWVEQWQAERQGTAPIPKTSSTEKSRTKTEWRP